MRGLHGDGSHFLLQMITSGKMTYPEASRITIHSLQQLPAFLLLHFGARSLHLLSVVYSLGLYLPAVLLTGACYCVLPPRRRGWFIFPVFNYVFGASVAGFPGILEGPVATAYFWLLLYSIVFLPDTRRFRTLTFAMALPAVYSHEVFGFLAPLLAVAAAWRSRRGRSVWSIDCFRGLALWFGFVALVQISYVLRPISVKARDGFFADFFQLVWLFRDDGGINIPAFLGFFALGAIGAAGLSVRYGRTPKILTISRWCEGITAVLCIATLLAPFVAVDALAPGVQFAARNHPAFIAVPLAILAWVSIERPAFRIYWMQWANLRIVMLLAAGTLGWQAGATIRWAEYVGDFRTVLEEKRGLIPWKTAVQTLPGSHRWLFAAMSWPWTNPTMSILLSPRGRVCSMLANPESVAWQPFDPAKPETLPRASLFDTSSYVRALSHTGG